jgi:hypothetical protein
MIRSQSIFQDDLKFNSKIKHKQNSRKMRSIGDVRQKINAPSDTHSYYTHCICLDWIRNQMGAALLPSVASHRAGPRIIFRNPSPVKSFLEVGVAIRRKITI